MLLVLIYVMERGAIGHNYVIILINASTYIMLKSQVLKELFPFFQPFLGALHRDVQRFSGLFRQYGIEKGLIISDICVGT